MADFSYSENSNRPISSVRLVYGADPRGNDQAWLERVDRCARLILQLKEDQLLSGEDPLLSQELYEMESVGFAPFDWDDDVEEEE
ncbi:hypothetical protein KC571_02355 [candidate division WWE3 bacterium]|uniref:Uncharacterized protein n=1 Tax=candidate division WWE3 bacterium TaxID=2053526 RepID=A0A955RQ93_UNCKA|nr:hypothetical protein [candidate division WWE3 bacterium]